jgi:hypothetical protein
MSRRRSFAGVPFLGVLLLLGGAPSPASGQADGNGPALVPFRHAMGIVPGYTRRSEAQRILGEPDRVQFRRPTEGNVVDSPGAKFLMYPRKGITLEIAWEKRDQDDPVIEAVLLDRRFRVASATGLSVGMPQNQALAICQRHYYIDPLISFGNTFMVAEKKGDTPALTLSFADGVLVQMRLDPSDHLPEREGGEDPDQPRQEGETFDGSDARARPFVTLLFAAQTGDLNAFKSVYSQGVHQQVRGEDDWKFGLRAVGAQFKERLGDLKLNDLRFTFKGDESSGRLFLAGNARNAFPGAGLKVIKEDGEWKLDEK